MRRSFGSGGSGMGGGNGGGMLRTLHRAVRAGAPSETFSTNSSTTNSRKLNTFNSKTTNHPNTALTLSSSSSSSNENTNGSFSSLINFPVSATTFGAGDDIMGWECVDGIEEDEDDERARVFYEDFVFGNVPSNHEVTHAVSALQQVLEPSFYKRVPKEEAELDEDVVEEVNRPITFGKKISSEMDWIEPSMHVCNSRILQTRGSDRIYDAFRLLQTEPSVQKMVISLSSDKAIWDAVLNNEAVKELRADLNDIKESANDASDDGSNPIKDMMSWVFVNSKAKIMQMIEKIATIVNEAFQPLNEEKEDPLGENLKTSLFLSIVVLLIVVVTRAQIA